MYNRITNTIKTYILILRFLTDDLVSFLDTNHFKRVYGFRRNQLILEILVTEPLLHLHRHGFQNPARSGNAHPSKLAPNLVLKLHLYFRYCPGHFRYIVDLPVHHRACFMAAHTLCHHHKTVHTLFIADRPDNTSCSYIKTKNQLFR